MTAEELALIAGVVLSLLFSYVPGLNAWFGGLDGVTKRLLMLAMIVISAAGAFGLACAGWGADFGLSLTCDRVGLSGLIRAAILCAMANQATYVMSTTPPAVRKALYSRDYEREPK